MADNCLTPSQDQNSKSWSKVCSGMLWDRVRWQDHDWTSLEVFGEDYKLQGRFLRILELIFASESGDCIIP